jgi:hypothetical protein
MTREPVIRFPVICPKCRQEVLATLPLGMIAAALISGRAIRLYASCHDVYWDAHHSEIEQIREYMAAPSLEALQATGDIRAAPDPITEPMLVGRAAQASSRTGSKA